MGTGIVKMVLIKMKETRQRRGKHVLKPKRGWEGETQRGLKRKVRRLGKYVHVW